MFNFNDNPSLITTPSRRQDLYPFFSSTIVTSPAGICETLKLPLASVVYSRLSLDREPNTTTSTPATGFFVEASVILPCRTGSDLPVTDIDGGLAFTNKLNGNKERESRIFLTPFI